MDTISIRDHDQLVALVRRRQDELKLSCLAIDAVAGLAEGHFSKLTSGVKRFGPVSIFLVLEALGLRIRIEEDPEAVARLSPRWEPRNESYVLRDNHWRRNAVAVAPKQSRSPWSALHCSQRTGNCREAGGRPLLPLTQNT
jgi:hypothetical protein